MKGHTEIKKLRIEVCAEGVLKTEALARTDAIKEALVGRGLDACRIESVGMGGGWSRVDFLIADTAAAPKAPGPGAAPAKTDAPATP
jgi:hypothetical protein